MPKFYIALVLGIGLLLAACEKEPVFFYNGMGKKPVYLSTSELNDIRNTAPRPIGLSGPIFLRDTLFFMLEQRKGIHVFSIADPANPVALAFWQIPAVSDFTISGNRLYADSWRDLLTIDISNLYDIRLLDRQINAFEPLLFPPLYNGPFECVDESKGAVVDWVDTQLENAKCWTVN